MIVAYFMGEPSRVAGSGDFGNKRFFGIQLGCFISEILFFSPVKCQFSPVFCGLPRSRFLLVGNQTVTAHISHHADRQG
mgnify:CR=1 FL=1